MLPIILLGFLRENRRFDGSADPRYSAGMKHIAALTLLSACLLQCTGQTPAQSAATVSNLRETVCGYVELTAPSTPELNHVRDLCRAGADLKPIAAAYAGCETQTVASPVTPVATTPPTVASPVSTPTDAGATP